MTKFTVSINYDLDDLRRAYRNFFGYPAKTKVTRTDIANWIGDLAAADIQDYFYDEDDEDQPAGD